MQDDDVIEEDGDEQMEDTHDQVQLHQEDADEDD